MDQMTDTSRGSDAGARVPGLGGPGPRLARISALSASELSRFIDTHFPALCESARERLFERARDADSDSVQTDCFDAMQEVERLRPTIGQRFVELALAQLDRVWGPDRATAGTSPPAVEELSLVDTNAMNDWLSMVAVVNRARPRLAAAEREVADQLERLLGVELTDDANPFGVQRLAGAFHDALQNLGAERRTRRALFAAFEATVATALPDLLGIVRELLSGAGVAPSASSRHAGAVRRGRRGATRRTTDPRRSRPEPSGAIEDLPEPETTGATTTPVVVAPPPAGAHQAAEPPPVGEGLRAEPFPAAADAAGSRTASQVGHLLRLCGDASVIAPSAVPDVDIPAAELATVDRALAKLAHSGRPPGSIATRVEAALAARGRRMQAPAFDALATADALVAAMARDPLVDSAVADLLERVAVPLARCMLVDAMEALAAGHPARRVLDALGAVVVHLEVPEAESPEPVLASVSELMGEAAGAPASVFRAAAEKLEPLVSAQAEHVRRRAFELVEARERQAALLESLRGAAPEPEHAEGRTDDPAWRAAVARSRRVRRGDVLLIDAGTAAAWVARVAWVAPRTHSVLLLDRTAERVETMNLHELALALHRDRVQPYPYAHESCVERAIQRVLGQLYGQAQTRAKHDALTGLATRRALEWEVAEAIERASPQGADTFLWLAQLDRFDALAHRLGEAGANRLLGAMASVLERQLGDAGTVARIYGSRFAVLLARTSRADTLARAERVRRTVEQARCVHRGESLAVGISTGIVPLGVDLAGPDDAMRAAEAVLVSAMATGNCVRIADAPSPGADSAAEAGDLSFRALLDAGRIALRAQRVEPLTDDGSRHPYHEILLGVRDADGRLQPPGRLIAVAERDGEIAALDRWVIATTIAWIAADSATRARPGAYAINLSGITLGDESLPDYVRGRLDDAGIDPGVIAFEVTESAAIDRLSTARAVLLGLRELGCRLALDDFGAGHASFGYLRSLPFDKVKIDGMFVREIDQSDTDRAMVRSIHEIARYLGMETVAEFVEGEAAIAALREIGVDYGQGYAIARPVALDAIG
ncbi:MAG: DUF1631 family protein [Ectothiorhodospiraceae bacterium]|nr:DUF1631 family protein [Ectothiorhodospiraceae bacterium]